MMGPAETDLARMADNIDRELAREERERREMRQLSLEMLNTTSPELAAEALEIGREFGVPRIAVEYNLPSYQAKRKAAEMELLRSASPKIMGWLENMDNHAVARDEINLLASLERYARNAIEDPIGMHTSTVKALARTGLAGAMGIRSLYANLDEEQLQKAYDYYEEYDAWAAREAERRAKGEGGWFNRLGVMNLGPNRLPYIGDMDPMPPPTDRLLQEAFDYNRSDWRRFLNWSAQGGFNKEQAIIAVKPMIKDKLDAAITLSREQDRAAREMMPQTGDFFADTLLAGVRTLVEMGPMVVTAVATRGKTLPAVVMGGQVYYNAYSEGREQGLDTQAATDRAIMQAAVEGISERLSLGIIDNMLKSDKGNVSRFAKAMLQEQGQEQVATLGGRLVDWNYLEQDKTLEEFIAETPRAALETAIITAVASGAMQGGFLLADMVAKTTVNDTLAAQPSASDKAIDEMLNAVGALKLPQRSPEKMREAVDTIVADTKIETVIVDLDGLTQSLMEAGQDPNETLLSMGIDPTAIDTAAVVQGEVEVKLSTLLSSPAISTVRDAIQPHIRLPGDTLTPKQKEAWQATAADYVQRGADLVREAAEKDAELASQIKDLEAEILMELDQVGMTGPAVNRANATLAARMVASIAVRQHRPVAEVWAETGPLLRRSMGQAAERAPAPVRRVERQSAKYSVQTEDSGTFEVTIIRLPDGGVAIISADATTEYPAAFAADKTDQELMAYLYEPVGYQSATITGQAVGEALASTFRPTTVTEAEQQQMEEAADRFEEEADRIIAESEFDYDMLDEELEKIRERYQAQIDALQERDIVQAAEEAQAAYLASQQPRLDAMDPDSDAYLEELDRVEEEGYRIYQDKYEELEVEIMDAETDFETARDTEVESETARLEAEAIRQIEEFRRQAITELIDRFEEAYGAAALLDTQYAYYSNYDTRERIILDENNMPVRLRDLLPQAEGETLGQTGGLVAAAVRVDGKIYRGRNHGEAVAAAMAATGRTREDIEGAAGIDAGFIDARGRFLRRGEMDVALSALAAGQIRDSVTRRIYEMMIRRGEAPPVTAEALTFGDETLGQEGLEGVSLDDPASLGLTPELVERVNPIYRRSVLPTEKMPSNQEAALWLEAQFPGEPIIDFTIELTDQQIEEIASVMMAEAMLALRESGNASDWYSEAMVRALGIASIKYPMLSDDAAAAAGGFGTASNARFIFTYIMAVTSQNLDVTDNSVATDKAFEEMVARLARPGNNDFSMPASWATGDKQKSMGLNFEKFEKLINAMPGETFAEQVADLDKMFRSSMTVKEWEAFAKKKRIPYTAPGQTAKDAIVYGSSVLGPKIGNGFWQNLNNNFDPLTIDLWMRRTWGRLTGKSIGNPDALPEQRARLAAAIKRSRSREQGKPDHIAAAETAIAETQNTLDNLKRSAFPTKKAFDAEERRLKAELKAGKEVLADLANLKAPEAYKAEYNRDNEALLAYAKRLLAVWNKEYKQRNDEVKKKYGKSAKVPDNVQPTWARAAKTIVNNLAKPLDQVANATQRKQIEKAAKLAIQKLADRGIDVKTADLQAILWYPEKELWGALTDELNTDEDGVPIVEPSVLNVSYDTVWAEILKEQGYEVPGIEGDGSGAGRAGGAVAGQDAGLGRPEDTAGAEGMGPVAAGSAAETLGQEALAERPQQPRVIYEVAPDPNNTALTDRWRQLTPEQRLAVSKIVAAEILPDVLRDLGASGRVLDQIGSYLDDTNPSFALALEAGDVDLVTKIIGFVLSQDSMMTISPNEFPGSFQTSALRIDVGEKTFEEIAGIYSTLRAITLPDGRQPIGGQTTSDGEMTILLGAEDDARAIAQLVDAALGNAYTVEIAKVFAAFPEKQEYDYASERDDPAGSAGLARQRARAARSEASSVLAREIDRIPRPEPGQRVSETGAGGPVQVDRGRLSSPRRLSDGTTEAVHYGRVAGLTETDPNQWGKGGAFLPREERNRIGEAPKRTYFGLNVGIPGGYVKEAGTGDNVYYAYIPLDRMYDQVADPDNLMDVARQIFRERGVAPRSAIELAIKEAGWAGYWAAHPALGMTAVMFEPVPVSTERRPDAIPPAEPLASAGTRGQYTPSTRILALAEQADASTFMHEMSHWYLDQVEKLAAGGVEWAVNELAEVESWYQEIKTSEQMQNVRSRYRVVKEEGGFRLMYKNMRRGLYPTEAAAQAAIEYVERQEAFAESFEQYLQTGKAPVPSLLDVFRQFKNWLVGIYKGLMPGPRASLSPQIQEVFDRMLAVDLEVDAASAETIRNAEEMARDMYQRGIITARQLADVGDRLLKAKEEVKEELLARAYEERMRKETAFWEKERKRIKGNIIRSFDRSPLGRAFNWLAYGEWKGDVPVDRKKEPPAERADRSPMDDIPFFQFEAPGSPEYEAAVAKGLDMSTEARMERARAMGFDVENVLYHGSPDADFRAFRPDQFFSRDPNYANRYVTAETASSSYYGAKGAAPGVYAVFVRGEAFDTRIPEHRRILKQQFAKKYGEGTLTGLGLPDWVEGRDIAEFLRETGLDKRFTRVIVDEGADASGQRPEATIVLDPSNIRSVNAAFDPDNVASAELLAQETLYSDPPGHGPITPPADLPAVRLNLAAVAELYGADVARRLPAAIRRRSSVATNVEDMLATAAQIRETLKGKGPQTLTQWIMRRTLKTVDGRKVSKDWGIKGSADELRNMGLERLINEKSGVTIDYVRESAQEQGFIFPSDESGTTTINDLLDALDREARGDPVVRPDDMAELAERAEAERWLDWYNMQGVDIYEKDQRKLRAALAEVAGRTDESLVTPDQAADLFGFETGEELLNALIAVGNKNDWINKETERQMIAEFGDMLRDGTLQAEAMEGARLDIYGRQAEIEMEALARALGKQAASNYARELAREHIRRQTVKEIMSFETHLAKERRFGQRALEAVKRGDYAAALKAKQAQLIAMQMYKEGKKAAQKLEKQRRDLLTYLDSDGRRAKIAPDYLEKIEALLEGYELRASKQGDKMRRRQMSAAEYVKQMIADGREVELPAEAILLAEAAQKERWRDLTADEADYLVATVQNMAHLGRTKQRLLDAQETRRFEAVIDDLATTLEAAPTTKERRQSFSPTTLETTATWLRKAHARLTRLELQFQRLDGQENGPLFQKLWLPFARAADDETTRMRGAAEEMRRLYDLFTPSQRNALFSKRVATPELGPRRGAGLTMMDIVVIGLNWGNAGNRQAIVEGYGWDAEQVEAMLNRVLEPQHWDFIEGMWALIGSYRADAFALEKSITGVEPKAVQAVPFTLRNGRQISGGYYPLKYSGTEPSALAVKQQKLDEAQMLSDMGKSFSKPMTATGHLIARVGSGGKPVRLSIDVAHEHVAAVIHDISYRKAVIDAHRIINNPRFTEAYISAAGREQYDTLRPWLASIATERTEEPGGFATDIMRGARRNFSIMAMGFKIGTSVQQLTGLAQAATVIGPRYVAQGFTKALTGGPASFWSSWNWVSQKSAFMRDRPMGFDRDVRQVTETTKAQTPLGAVQRNAFFLIGMMDTVVSTSTWLGAYNRALDGNVKGIDREDEQAAIDYADSVVRRTQSAGRTQDLPQMMRGTELEKLLTVVYSYFSTLYNFTAQQTIQVRTGQVNPVAFAANMTILYIIVPVMAAFLAGRIPLGEEEDEEEIAALVGKEIASNAVGTIPFFRDIMSSIINPQYGYQMSPAGSVIESAAIGAGGIIRGEGFKTEFATRKSLETIGVLFGLPTAQLWITGDYVYDLATGMEQPVEDPVDAAREALLRSER